MADYNSRQYGGYDREDSDSHGDDALVTKQDKQKLSALANDAMKKGTAAMSDAELGKTEKFFGINIDSGLAAYLSSTYNVVSGNIGKFIGPKTYNLTTKIGEQMGMAPKSTGLKQTAAVTTFVVNVGLKAAADIGKITTAFSEQRKDRQKMVQHIAPVLDDIKGRHSLGAFAGVRESDNEVIYAHRQRMARMAKSENTNRIVSMLVNVVPNVALDVTTFNHMWGGMTPKAIKDAAQLAAAKKLTESDDSVLGNLGETFIQVTSGQISERISKGNQLKLRKGLQPYSSLEMILELQKQVESNPKSSSFQLPKGFENSNKHPKSYPLEEYVALIFIQHQREMVDFTNDHTEIREALHDDLTAAIKPVVKSIRAGSLDAMSLIRLVGERKIIKNKGRAIAEPHEVEELIKHSDAYVHTDLEEFYRNASRTREEMKKLLDKLEGQDRAIYLALLPDAVKEDLGVPRKEIKAHHDEVKKAKHPNRALADLTVAAHSESQFTLKTEGLAKPEIQLLDSAYAAIKRDGIDAVNDFKTSATNPKGLEHILANWAVPHIQGGKDHLGKVMEKGHSRMEEITSKLDHQDDAQRKENDRERDHESEQELDVEQGSHASRQKARSDADHGTSREMD